MADRQLTRWLDAQSRREVWLLRAASPADWPDVPPWQSTHFGLFVAVDREADLGSLPARALQQGLALSAAWGPSCGAIETAFDLAVVDSIVETDENVILTTSHANDSLEEALEYFLDVAFAAHAYAESCNTWVIFAIGSTGDQMRRALLERDAKEVHA